MEKKEIRYHITKPIQDYSDLRLHNLSLVLRLIMAEGAISRIDLSHRTGLSATSMTRICSSLIEAGLVRELPDSERKVGRRALVLAVDKDRFYYFCVVMDVGSCQCAIMGLNVERIAYREFYTTKEMTCSQILTQAKRVLESFCEEMELDSARISAVGISTVGGIDHGVIYYSPQFDWAHVPVRETAEEIFQLPVIVENDCKAALKGECSVRYGTAPPANVCYLALNRTGVGTATMLNGHLLRGAMNMAGEIGHSTIDLNGMRCDCGRNGCLQTFLVEKFLVQRTMKVDPKISSIIAITDAISDGNKEICALMEDLSQYIAVILNTMICAYNPDVIIINDAHYLNLYSNWVCTSEDWADKYIFRPMVGSVQIKTSILRERATMTGIACVTEDLLLQAKLREIVRAEDRPSRQQAQ